MKFESKFDVYDIVESNVASGEFIITSISYRTKNVGYMGPYDNTFSYGAINLKQNTSYGFTEEKLTFKRKPTSEEIETVEGTLRWVQ